MRFVVKSGILEFDKEQVMQARGLYIHRAGACLEALLLPGKGKKFLARFGNLNYQNAIKEALGAQN